MLLHKVAVKTLTIPTNKRNVPFFYYLVTISKCSLVQSSFIIIHIE